MKFFGAGLSDLHRELSASIKKKDEAARATALFLELHSKLNLSEISNSEPNEVDTLLADLSPEEFGIMPTAKDETIAWVLWHLARIEDLTMSFLVAGEEQVFNTEWKKKLNAPIDDTGNALSDDEIIDLSGQLDVTALIAYRSAVGKRTRDIVKRLSAVDLKQKVSPQGLEKIRESGGVTTQPESLWLLDYWGKKDVAGLLLMPPTRHAMMHLNDCAAWKLHIRAGKKCFRSGQSS